jgi:hypothetical protein
VGPWYFWSLMDIRQLAYGLDRYIPETLILNGYLRAKLNLGKELSGLGLKAAEDKPTVIKLDNESFVWLWGDELFEILQNKYKDEDA